MAAALGFALSDAAQKNCIPTPKAICQSKKGKDMGGGSDSGGRKERVKAKNGTCPGSK